MFKVDKEINVPAYRQIESYLREAINSGELLPGDLLPADIEFSKTLGVNPRTLAKGLAPLAREGLITRKKKGGTRIAENSARIHQLEIGVSDFPFVSAHGAIKLRLCISDYTPHYCRIWEKIIAGFMKQHPDITIESKVEIRNDFNFDSEIGFDLFPVYDWQYRLLNENVARPLDMATLPDKKKFVSPDLYDFIVKSDSEGKPLAAPFALFAPIVIGNADILGSQKFKIPANWNWQQFFQTLTDFQMKLNQSVQAHVDAAVLRAHGTGFLVRDLISLGRNKKQKELADIFKSLNEFHIACPKGLRIFNSLVYHQDFCEGRIGLRIGSISTLSACFLDGMNTEDLRVGPMPRNSFGNFLTTKMLCINAKTLFPEAAEMFVSYLLGDKAQSLIAETLCTLPVTGSGINYMRGLNLVPGTKECLLDRIDSFSICKNNELSMDPKTTEAVNLLLKRFLLKHLSIDETIAELIKCAGTIK
jgi:DNA-binding transcriptional regulator YhcF (GntR family)